MNFKKLRKYLLIALIILYIGIIIFESAFNFNQKIIGNLLSNYEDFAQPLYVLMIIFAIIIGLISSAVVLSGFFIFNMPTLVILTSIGVIVGVPLIFILARKIGRKSFEQYIDLKKGKAEKLKEIFRKDSMALIVLFNFVFFLPSTFGGIVGGLGVKKLTKPIVISLIGNLINQISFIFFISGIQFNNLSYLVPSVLALALNTGIPLWIYRKNIGDVLRITFRKDKK
ncbi:MAG TPA: hypothetical protein VMC80_02565 [Patescibacteria group bacterium]|nr:hypothetical protein [Patescibacteria group bacterium]